jgi:two-component system, cell cycle sensor histidine kinase and response regulator CckA
MNAPVRLLICEDSDDDALLIVTCLRRAGLAVEHERADTAAQVGHALRTNPPDLVISDYHMPGFGAERALELVHASGLDLPFILVSGRVGEEHAVNLMRAGAHDYVLKDHLARLVPVVRRELRQARDRRERRDAQAALRLSERRFRVFAEHTPDVMFRYRLAPTEAVEYLSPACLQVLGRPAEELCGDPSAVFDLAAPEDRATLHAAWHSPDPHPVVVHWKRPDGTDAWTEQRAVALHDDDGRVLVVEGILRDVTERVLADAQRERLRQKLRQADRLESLGRLAGGIAHDFNNLLAVILGHTDLALAELPDDSPHRDGLELIRDLAGHGAALTRHLLVFSRQEPLRPELLDGNDVVAETERVLRGAIGEDVAFTTRLADGLWPVRIDRSELERLLLNLVANSRRAMPHGGRLAIETENLTAETGAPLVRIAVTDTGTGMSDEVRCHAFEPFYTTDPAVGTGLGLSTAYGVVKAAGGEITLGSCPGSGTTVRIDLPAHPALVVEAPAPPPAREFGHGQRLLVVEDDDAVRDLVALMVRRGGYQATCTASPHDALNLVRRAEVPVDALVTDMVMAGMSGIELAQAARAHTPGLPVLLMSGYTAGTLPDAAALPDGMELLRKPFTTAALLHAIAGVLHPEPRPQATRHATRPERRRAPDAA